MQKSLAVLGTAVFLVTVTLCVMTYLLNWTTTFASIPSYSIQLGGFKLFSLTHGETGSRIAEVWDGVWFLAVASQVVMLLGWMTRPRKRYANYRG